MIEVTWTKQLRSDRAKINHIETDVWKVAEGYRYTILDCNTKCYLDGGVCKTEKEAKEKIDAHI